MVSEAGHEGATATVHGIEPLRLKLEEARREAGGILHVRGWAVASLATQSVEVLLGGHSLGFADALLSREDVGAAFPHYPNAGTSGFALRCEIPAALAHEPEASVIVTDAAGRTRMARIALTGSWAGAPDEPARPPAPSAPMVVSLEEARINEIGVLRVRGWIVSLSPVEQVRVYLDDAPLGTAAQQLPREDVALAHPEYPDAAHAGFLLQQEIPDGALTGRLIRVSVTAVGGIRRDVTVPLVVAPVVRRRERPGAAVEIHCDTVSLTENGALFLRGWAVCASGVATIEVELGDEAIGQAEPGEERPDVGNHFPQIPSARNAGFRFLGRAPFRCAGEYVVRITVHGRDGEHRVVLQPVLAVPGEATAEIAGGEKGIRYYLDTPAIRDGKGSEAVRGFLSLNGWAFSSAGIASIEVFVDDRSQGQAYRGIRREDLYITFGRKDALRSGFAMLVPPQVMKRGRHDIKIVILDNAGQREEIAFAIDAEPSMDGPGPWALRRKLTHAEIDLQSSVLTAAGYRPEYTLLLPFTGAASGQIKRLRATLDSLRHQAYPDWHLLIPVPTDADRDLLHASLLPGFADLAPHLRLTSIGASVPLADLLPRRTRPALLCLLAPGDQLGEDALLELAVEAAVQAGPQLAYPDLLYSDERRIDPADGMTRAFFKPDWSPDLMLSTNYIGRLWAARAELLERTGAVFGDLARHGEYDLALRMSERAERIAHVAKVLVSRGARTLDSPATERRALARALLRRGIAADIHPGCIPGTFRVQRAVRQAGMVSIIIPTIASRGLIRTAIASIREKSTFRNFEIICLDNITDDGSADAAHWKSWIRNSADRVIETGEKFNWSRFNNLGAEQARGDYLLFLNDDIEVLDGDWLLGLIEHAQRDDVGAVGPQLLYPDGKVQHAGLFLSGRIGRHAFRFSPGDEPGPYGLALTQRNVIGVTGACLMVRRDIFEDLGGFNEDHAVINNDLDFCLRVRRSGRTVIYTPHVRLLHHEMVSRGELRDTYNAASFDTAWKDLLLSGDPYFNPNLAPDVDDYVPDQEPFQLVHVGHPVIAREKVRRILALKVDHIGDFISAFPAFRRLKEQFPNAELTVLAASASLSLAALEPAIDRVIRFDFFHARSERGRRASARKELLLLQDELAALQFDLAVDLRRQPDTRHLLQHTGARWLAGFDQENRTRWLDIAVEWEGDVARAHKRTHISDALVQFVDAIAVACEADRQVVRSPQPMAQARAALRKLPELDDVGDVLFERRVVCVHVGAGSENKQWPVASFAGVIDLLVAGDDVNVAVIGGPDEAALADALTAAVRHPERIFSMVGLLSLRTLPLLLRSCDLYIGNDSGPKHMASALRVPTVGIHAGSVDAVEWGPMGPAAFGVRRAMTCSPCYLAKVADCHRGLACLNGIRVSDVYRASRRMLLMGRLSTSRIAAVPAAGGAIAAGD